ncbi:MAG TPA: hypothetical protein VFQ20_04730 [Burkholderiaceae bacterium]|nr:hypothetical protein [Burkholderiaceae bacterium]
MHWIVPFARAGFEAPDLPALGGLVARCAIEARDDGEIDSPHPPHERALARALGWPVADDAPLPWAARAARADGIEVGAQAWALLTPVHWRVGSDAVHLADPRELGLSDADSRALFDAVRPLFESEGMPLAWGAATRWYASHASFEQLATASLDRAIGRNVDPWLPSPRHLRRLQNEVQMLLHAHPINAAREAAGAPAVNSFWISGCGIARAEASVAVRLDDRLARPALASDEAGWRAAWATLDAELVAAPAFDRLTLCGERGSVTLTPRAQTLWQRLAGSITKPRGAAAALLETL